MIDKVSIKTAYPLVLGTDNLPYAKQNAKVNQIQDNKLALTLDLFLDKDLMLPDLYLKNKHYDFTLIERELKNLWEYPYVKAEDSMFLLSFIGFLDKNTKKFQVREQDIKASIYNGNRLLATEINSLDSLIKINKQILLNSALNNLRGTLLQVSNTVGFYTYSQLKK